LNAEVLEVWKDVPGYMSADPKFIPEAQLIANSVQDEVAFALENICLPPEEIRRRVTWALRAVRLSGLERKHPSELSGGEKTKESFWELLRAPKILTRRYGLIYVQFGEPISLRALAEQRFGGAAASLSLEGEERETDSKRQLVQHLSNRTVYEIGRAITVTPVGALASVVIWLMIERRSLSEISPTRKMIVALVRSSVTQSSSP
jgi:hypothetical protein